MTVDEKDPPGNCVACNKFMKESENYCEVCSKPVCDDHVRNDPEFECTYCPKCWDALLNDGA